MKSLNFTRLKLTTLAISLIVLSGCSLWQNFTTYFNLYYNTSTIFEEAEEEILSQKRDLFSTDPLIIPGSANTKLTKVIEKSSKILQFNATTSYVDDALMMLGKSFFYQKNYQKSKRKFEELLGTEPDRKMRLEAEYWIAKCYMSLKDYVNALTLLEKVRTEAISGDDEEIVRGTYKEEIVYRISREDYSIAIELAEQMIPYADSELKSAIYFELGKLYTEIDDLEKANLAYEKVFDFSPDFDLDIAANINYAVTLRKAGRNEDALNVFQDMRKKDKFTDKFSEIDLEIAITLEELGRYDEAFEKFTVVDTTYKNTPIAAASSYFKGRIYQFNKDNYDSAAYYYQRAFTGNPPVAYQQAVKEKNQLFNKYFNLRNQINNYDRQFFYAQNPDIFIKDSIDYVEDSLKILSDFLEQKELQDIWSNVFKPDSNAIKDSLLALDSLRIQDSILVRDSLMTLMNLGMYADTNEVNLAILEFFRTRDSLQVRDSLMALMETGTFIDTTEVNRALENYFRKKEQEKLDANKKNQLNIGALTGVSLDSVKFKNNPPKRPVIPVDSVKYIIAKSQLELGNLFLTEINEPDSAFYLYSDNTERFSESEFYPNTLYALGSYYLTMDDKPKADSLFKYIYENYKDRSIVNAAAFRLNLSLIDLDYDPAKKVYSDAESKMIAGDYREALKEFLSIYRLYPESPFSPKGLYAGGWILEKDLNLQDSAAVVYDTLVVKYGSTVYARDVVKKLSGYKQEVFRKQQEEEAKLLASKNPQSDSLIIGTGLEKQQIEEITGEIPKPVKPVLDQTKKPETKPDETADDPVVSKPEEKIQVTKLEALWNPRKPR